jgi:hypothetical protein
MAVGLVFIAICDPGCDLATKAFEVADAAVETSRGEDAEFALGLD